MLVSLTNQPVSLSSTKKRIVSSLLMVIGQHDDIFLKFPDVDVVTSLAANHPGFHIGVLLLPYFR